MLVSLEQTFYSVNESSGTLEVCVVSPGLRRSINITLLPINGSAQGRVRRTAGNFYYKIIYPKDISLIYAHLLAHP